MFKDKAPASAEQVAADKGIVSEKQQTAVDQIQKQIEERQALQKSKNTFSLNPRRRNRQPDLAPTGD